MFFYFFVLKGNQIAIIRPFKCLTLIFIARTLLDKAFNIVDGKLTNQIISVRSTDDFIIFIKYNTPNIRAVINIAWFCAIVNFNFCNV